MTARLIQGDCFDVLPTITGSSVDMVFADLPYGVTANKWDTPLDLNSLWKHLLRIGKLKCAFVFTATQPFATTLINSQKKLFKYDLVWDKIRGSNFANARRSPMRSHESILIFYTQCTYVPQKTDGHAPVKVKTNGVASSNYGIKPTARGSDTKRYPLSVQSFKRDDMRNKNGHPTQKPVALLEWLIKTYTNEGDTVLDPTSGSGTTAVAALRTNRHSICIEQDPTYHAAAEKRIQEELTHAQAS